MNGALLPRCEQDTVNMCAWFYIRSVYEYVVACMNMCPVIVLTWGWLVLEHVRSNTITTERPLERHSRLIR